MAAEVQLVPEDDRGREIIDELEERTGKLPFKTDRHGARNYYLESAGVDGFDAMLDKIDSDWRNHLHRLSE